MMTPDDENQHPYVEMQDLPAPAAQAPGHDIENPETEQEALDRLHQAVDYYTKLSSLGLTGTFLTLAGGIATGISLLSTGLTAIGGGVFGGALLGGAGLYYCTCKVGIKRLIAEENLEALMQQRANEIQAVHQAQMGAVRIITMPAADGRGNMRVGIQIPSVEMQSVEVQPTEASDLADDAPLAPQQGYTPPGAPSA